MAPPVTATLTATGSDVTAPPAASAATSSVPVFAPPPPPDDNFLKVSYSLDGQTWIDLATVNQDNWQNFTATLPVTSWDDLKKLQVRIEGIPTALTQIPKVYLDGMFVEVHYEIPPASPISLGGSTAATPSAATTSEVIVLPPTQQPVPVNQNSDFKANESPTFDFNLNALPGPTSTTEPAPAPAAPEVAPTSSPPATTTPSSTSLSRPPSPLSFFFRAADFFRTVGKAAAHAIGLDRWFTAYAQLSPNQSQLPDANNPIIAQIFGPDGKLTNLQPVILVTGGNLRVILPNQGRAFMPGGYLMKLLIWQNGVAYQTQSDFSWGVLAVNFNKSIYKKGDTAKIGLGFLNPTGHTICDGNIAMDISSPSGKIYHFSTGNKTILRGPHCAMQSFTNDPDYSATLIAAETGTYNVAIAAQDPSTGDAMKASDSFEAQTDPQFDVERAEATRIYPPMTYRATIKIIPNADYAGPVTETVPSGFTVTTDVPTDMTTSGDDQTITWQVVFKKGIESDFGYSFKAPDASPELYKLGPLTIGSWQESRQWQIAADAIAKTKVFIISTASTTWKVPNDWDNASNTIEAIGAGGGGTAGTNSNRGGAGGGGGAYAEIINKTLTIGASTTIQVGLGATAASGTDTFFGSSTCATSFVCAKGGQATTTKTSYGLGGASSTSVGSTTYPGGNGGPGNSSYGSYGGGGGGAGGKSGAGSAGLGTATSTGGNADLNNVTGGAINTAGNTGTEWDSTHGSGSGSGGRNTSAAGIAGVVYGGGGGGGYGTTGGSAGGNGIIVITYLPRYIILGTTTQPSNITIGPGAAATTSNAFTFATDDGTSTITSVNVGLSTTTGIFQVQITNSSGTTVYGSSTNPGSTSLTVTTTAMGVSTTATTFRTLIQPLSYPNMPAPPGGTYVVTSTITGWTDVNTLDQTSTPITSNTLTIDNQQPANVTNASGTATSSQVTFSWTNSTSSDFATTTVLRATSSVAVAPTNGTTTYVSEAINATTTVACVVASSTAGCTDTSLSTTTYYYYEIFAANTYANYSTGVVPAGNPFLPSGNRPPTVSKVVLNGNAAIVLNPGGTQTVTAVASTTDPDGAGDIRYATSTIYLSSVGSNCTANNLNCYQVPSSSCSFSNSTSTVSCSANIYYFADATDASSSFNGQTWNAAITVTDSASNTNTSSTASGVTLQTLLAMSVAPTSITYGTLAPAGTSATNLTTTVQNAGNCSTTLQLSVLASLMGGHPTTTLVTSSQQYATSSGFTYGTGYALSSTPVTLNGFTLAAPVSTTSVSGNIFWGLRVPTGTPTGTYLGTTTFSALYHL
jgi:hypothetical protein